MSNLGSGSHDSQWAETIVSTIIKKLNLSPDNGGYRARQLREMLCAFCSDREHFIRDCLKLVDYISKGWCKRDQDNQIVVADGTKVTPRLAPGRDIKERIDNWRKMNPTVGTVSTNVVEVHTIETSKIEEVDEKYIDTGVTYATKREMEDIEMYEALAATAMKKAEEVRKKSGAQGNGKSTGPTTRSMSSKEAEIGAAKQEAAKQAPTTRTHTSNEKQGTTPGQNGSQYKYVSAIEDPKIIEAVARRGLNSSMTLTMHELLAISPEIRKYTRDLISTKRVGPGANKVVDDEIQEDEIPDLVDIPDSDSEYSVDDDESTWDASDEVSNHDEAELNPALRIFSMSSTSK
ncbi:hypothetical protein BJ912DRAFT_929887 [Pholiota molesta]|nr:hypothetical protein BJ912DRAFT_929887 [Pholiota molesta]